VLERFSFDTPPPFFFCPFSIIKPNKVRCVYPPFNSIFPLKAENICAPLFSVPRFLCCGFFKVRPSRQFFLAGLSAHRYIPESPTQPSRPFFLQPPQRKLGCPSPSVTPFNRTLDFLPNLWNRFLTPCIFGALSLLKDNSVLADSKGSNR